MSETPEWIYPGAEVILLVDDRDARDDPTFGTATVSKIASLSFTVNNFTHHGRTVERIYFKNLSSKDFGSSYRRWHYRVINPNSPEVIRLEAVHARAKSREAARRAMRDLVERHDDARMDDLTLLREAVVALTAHADIVLTQQNKEN